MPDRTFLDSNVLIYGLTSDDDKKRRQARSLFASRYSVISTQVLMETSNVLIRKAGAKPADVAQILRGFSGLQVVNQTPEIVEEALRISGRYGFGVFDAAIVASALHAKCTVLLSEDLQHDQKIETLRVVNPFASP